MKPFCLRFVTFGEICLWWSEDTGNLFGETCLWWSEDTGNLSPQETTTNLDNCQNNHFKALEIEKSKQQIEKPFSFKKNCLNFQENFLFSFFKKNDVFFKNSECLWHSCPGNAFIPWLMLSFMKCYWGGVGNENQHLCCQRVST